MSTIHLALVSSQAVPNITPILDERFRPQRVVMMLSEDMQAHAECLERIFRPRGVAVDRWIIDDPWDIEHIRNRVIELLTRYENHEIILNVTGGSKPMSIAAYEVFRAFEKPIFYVHPEKDRLIWMYPGDRDSVDLADRIKLAEFLQAYGADRVVLAHTGGVRSNLRELTAELIGRIELYAPALGSLNYFAAMARNNRLSGPEIGTEFNGRHDFWELVELFEQADLLRRENRRLLFPDEDARFIANGGWLELHAYACCLNLKKPLALQDVGRGVEVSRRRGGDEVLNELDVAFLKDNRLYLLECKTRLLKGGNNRHDEGANVLYKLDSLRDLLGGLQARAMFVSFNPIKPHNRRRAHELNIEYCCHRDLQSLEERIGQWLTIDR